MGKAVAKKQMDKAAGSLDIVGSALDLSKATSGFTDSNIAKKYNLNKIDTPDLKSVADFKEFGKQFDAPQTGSVHLQMEEECLQILLLQEMLKG